MTYDLYFWKQHEECNLEPANVIQQFSENQTVDGIDPLPAARVIERIKREFPDAEEQPLGAEGCSIQLFWEHESDGCFIALPCTTYLCVESHQATGDVLNRLIDIANEFGCPLYDPQTNQRYCL